MMTEDSEDPRRIASLLRHPLAGGGMSSPSFGHHTLHDASPLVVKIRQFVMVFAHIV
jgi:hypothetical protein